MNRRYVLLAACMFLVGLAGPAALDVEAQRAATQPATRPNIVLIFPDNLGWGDRDRGRARVLGAVPLLDLDPDAEPGSVAPLEGRREADGPRLPDGDGQVGGLPALRPVVRRRHPELLLLRPADRRPDDQGHRHHPDDGLQPGRPDAGRADLLRRFRRRATTWPGAAGSCPSGPRSPRGVAAGG